ncbi:MAG: hypothetical protein ACI9WS_001475 [Paraglaciecola psychrophila]
MIDTCVSFFHYAWQQAIGNLYQPRPETYLTCLFR